jgi:acetate kinase
MTDAHRADGPAPDILVLNAGSSSLKVRVLDAADAITAELELDRWDGSADDAELREFLDEQTGIGGVGHRVVHGGRKFTEAVLIDDDVLAGITELSELAPLHQSRSIAGIEAAMQAMPDVPEVACFDTSFHADMPAAAATYALPGAWRRRYGLRKYGFHGLSHAYAAGRAAQMSESPGDAELRVVSCHLGAGSSLAAVQGGRSVDTTMGFTPLDGLVMATRSGSVDPGLIIWLEQHAGMSADVISTGLETASGLAGLAALPHSSGDLRHIRQSANAGNAGARLAIEVHNHRLRGMVAAMAAAMNGLDTLVFTGGIGEHQPQVRAEAAAGLSFLGVAVDPERNQATSADGDISADGAAVRTLVVTAREDVEIARQVRRVLTRG